MIKWAMGLLALIASAAGISCATPKATETSGEYLPLAVGTRWELRARGATSPMLFEVTGRDGNAFIVRWTNPFVPGLRFRFADGPRVRLTGLDMGRGLGPIPGDVVYFDFSRRKGEQWTNGAGRFTVTGTGVRVSTAAGTYDNCIEIETTDHDGQSMYWTFAPGVGFVRWGRGSGTYTLASVTQPGAPTHLRTLTDGKLRISIDANPSSAENLDAGKSYQIAVDSGITLIHLPPTWTQIETSQGQYSWGTVDLPASVAASFSLPINLNVRIVDTSSRSIPSFYSWGFADQQLADRLIAALQALAPRTKNRVRWIALGNEIDVYFATHASELPGYVTLLQRVLPTVRQLFPDALFTVSFTYGGIGQLANFQAVTNLIDCYSFTYYPMNADFTMRAPSAILDDLPRMVAAAQGKPLILQEVGYASAASLNSSEQKQADFVTNTIQALRQQDRAKVIGATFLFMSDLPSSTVDELVKYYQTGNTENFRAYLSTLGLRTTAGTPKAAWNVFVTEARRLKSEGTP